ncbi:1-hydroxycarotenoid 3,4-desaturase CrtD [Congregibacter litoralis]|uniref:Phytoene desaturase n=1 Tax=Congregibacter litoralis KT71 TaxID=314285 RepID=A4A9W0_9GAMM|nr:1-hydroxycarotenoid 3,4-desaturase CrtD [Congregibacter litoralis]EAQ97277.1 phytoene desaturase [Congregibacter litoralis KT71]
MSNPHTLVIGAGVGGLAAAVELAAAGQRVTVLERAAEPGGKMRQLPVDGVGVDAGPTVFTMRWIFDQLFATAGSTLEAHLRLEKAEVLARHAWRQGGVLDLFASTERSEAAILAFAGKDNALGYRSFCARSADIYGTLREPFIASSRPGMLELVRRVGFGKLDAMWRTAPFSSLWSALDEHFSDPRLRQLFGRYATYVGSSPLRAPATLMLIAHVEQEGVWLVDGGMRAVAAALRDLAEGLGVKFFFEEGVRQIIMEADRAVGALTENNRELRADQIVYNGDISALGNGMLGAAVTRAVKPVMPQQRALSAITFCMRARVSGLHLHYHTVFFAEDYPAEFAAIFGQGDITAYPTVYVCAQDRGAGRVPEGPERLLLLINAPADGDRRLRDERSLLQYRDKALAVLRECGCELEFEESSCVTTDPRAFDERFPGSGGSLYGRANHGSMASFARPGARSRVKGLYLAGGSVHPGAGVPMSAMSGRLAAGAVLEDQR